MVLNPFSAFTRKRFRTFLAGIKPPKNLSPAERKQWLATLKAQAQIDAAVGIVRPTPARPPKFPMKFREFLRRMFGGRLHADRLRLYRKFVFQEMRHEAMLQGIRPPAAQEAAAEVMRDELIAKLSCEGITDPSWYFHTNERIHFWRKSNRLQQRRAANEKRWLKESRKKILWLLQKRISDMSQREKCSFASPKGKKVTGSHRRK